MRRKPRRPDRSRPTCFPQSRLQASFFYSREDRARFSGMDEAPTVEPVRRPVRWLGQANHWTGTEWSSSTGTNSGKSQRLGGHVLRQLSLRAGLWPSRWNLCRRSVGRSSHRHGKRNLWSCRRRFPQCNQRWRPSRTRRPDGRHRRRESFGSCSGCYGSAQAGMRDSAWIAPGYGRPNLGRRHLSFQTKSPRPGPARSSSPLLCCTPSKSFGKLAFTSSSCSMLNFYTQQLQYA